MVFPAEKVPRSYETRSRLGLSGFDEVIFGVVALLIPRKGHQVLLESILSIRNNKEAQKL